MAIVIFGRSECRICGALLKKGDNLFATSGCWMAPGHPLFAFQDAAMHRDCFDTWPLRTAFVASFNGYFSNQPSGARRMHEDGSIETIEPRRGDVA